MTHKYDFGGGEAFVNGMNENSEAVPLGQCFKTHVLVAYDAMAPLFLGEIAETFKEHFTVEIVDDRDDTASFMPTARYDSTKKAVALIINPESTLNYAEDLATETDHDVEPADIARILIGAGVARTILGLKTTLAGLADKERSSQYLELICSKTRLWDEVAEFDESSGSVLRPAVERMGDDQIPRVNLLRFALGASLRYMSQVIQLQQALVDHQRAALLDLELTRSTNLRFNQGWMIQEDAFTIYDDSLPEFEFAFSFPMTPAEEQEFTNY